MSAPLLPDVNVADVRTGACGICGRPVLMDETGEREVKTCFCGWAVNRYAKAGDTHMVPVRTTMGSEGPLGSR